MEGGAAVRIGARKPDYKGVALSNTTLGTLMAMINSSILLIALPDIFRGIGIDPLQPGNTSYLLWLLLGFLVVLAVLLVSLGRLGDMYGRVRMFNLGFAVFTPLLDPALGHVAERRRRRALADPDARRSGGRRRAHLRQLERDSHRRVPARGARTRTRDQQRLDGRRLVPPARARGRARTVRVAARVRRLGAGPPHGDDLVVPLPARGRRGPRRKAPL